MSITCTTFNLFPNGQSQGSGFFLTFGRDVYIPTVANQVQAKLRYLGDKSSLLSVEMLREAYMLAAIHFKRTRDRQPSKGTKKISKSKVRHLVLLKITRDKDGMQNICHTLEFSCHKWQSLWFARPIQSCLPCCCSRHSLLHTCRIHSSLPDAKVIGG